MDDEMNDYDRIAEDIGEALAVLMGNTHEPGVARKDSDSITMTKDGFITAVVRLQRLRDWVEGLAAEKHRMASMKDYDVGPMSDLYGGAREDA